MRISCHFERSAAESRNLVLSTLLKTGLTDLKTGLTDLSTSARYNPAFGRDDNGASFNHNWYKWYYKIYIETTFDQLKHLLAGLKGVDN